MSEAPPSTTWRLSAPRQSELNLRATTPQMLTKQQHEFRWAFPWSAILKQSTLDFRGLYAVGL
jgi:hypothetical protein